MGKNLQKKKGKRKKKETRQKPVVQKMFELGSKNRAEGRRREEKFEETWGGERGS